MHGSNKFFKVGELYSHEEIYRSLGVGNAGGIRPAVGKDGETRRLVLMTSSPSARILRENPYHDRVEGDFLVYTAAGLEGNQEFSGINRRLIDQHEIPFPIYGFCNIGSRRDLKLGPRRWRFLGLLQYIRHFKEMQIDVRGENRNSVVFELLIHDSPQEIMVDNDCEISASVCLAARQSERLSPAEVEVQRESISRILRPVEVIDGAKIETVRRSLLSLNPERFEHVVKEALSTTGFERVSVSRYTADGGIDVTAFAGGELWPINGCLLQVQAKRWLHTVGRREVAELRGSLKPHARGAIVTTSFYSKAALTEASEEGKLPVVLLNGLELSEILIRSGREQTANAASVGAK